MSISMLPEFWRRDLPLAKAKSGADVTHACHADVARCLYKIEAHNGAGRKESIGEELQRAHDAMAKCDEAQLRAVGIPLDDESAGDDDDGADGRVGASDKAAGDRFDARTDIAKIDPRDPLAFRKAVTVVYARPVITGRWT